jgi:hypothetical protein
MIIITRKLIRVIVSYDEVRDTLVLAMSAASPQCCQETAWFPEVPDHKFKKDCFHIWYSPFGG